MKPRRSWAEVAKALQQHIIISELETVSALVVVVKGSAVSSLAMRISSTVRPGRKGAWGQ